MSAYRIVRNYPHPVEEVWEVVTSPDYVRRWTTTGRGGRPEGFAPVVGTQFRFVGKPTLGWAGTVYCEVHDVAAPRLLRYSWRGDEDGDPTQVTYRLEPTPTGTRFTWEHTGFTGVGGWVMSRLLRSVRRKMLTEGVPSALVAYQDEHAA